VKKPGLGSLLQFPTPPVEVLELRITDFCLELAKVLNSQDEWSRRAQAKTRS
jgi:hypothetical protein